MRSILVQMSQDMTTQAQAAMVQAQAMTAQANRYVAPMVHEQTMDCGLRDLTRMSPPIFYRSKADEDPQELIDEVYKILCSRGCVPMRMLSWPHTNRRMWLRLGMYNER